MPAFAGMTVGVGRPRAAEKQMPTYTVHAPPPKNGDMTSAPERFRFVRDGFHFWAFVLPPVWLLAHRLWLAFIIYAVLYAGFSLGLAFLGASSNVQMAAGLLIGLAMGFEAPSIRRWTLSRRRWQQLGFVVGDDEEMAERRFYAEWAKQGAAPATDTSTPPSSEPAYAPLPARRGPPSGHDVIGLFPAPERPR